LRHGKIEISVMTWTWIETWTWFETWKMNAWRDGWLETWVEILGHGSRPGFEMSSRGRKKGASWLA
jgi:hypothetical protein